MENSESLFPLTFSEAEKRKNCLVDKHENNLSYNLIIHLKNKILSKESQHEINENYNNNYSGRVEIHFNYTIISENLFLDYKGTVLKLSINGINQTIVHRNNRILINHQELLINSNNIIVVNFESTYSNSGDGRHHSNIDNFEYIYTCFEPFECNTVFPCFDQPDLKAKFKLILITDSKWIIISNTREKWSKLITNDSLSDLDMSFLDGQTDNFISGINHNSNLKITVFTETKVIPTYVFGFCAGDYYCFNIPYEYDIPMRIFTTRKFKNEEERFLMMFKDNMKGINFLTKYLDTPYQFCKYDMVFVPDFPSIALEIVGCVIFSDSLLQMPYIIESQKRMTNLTLHELSHMWFGNLVTPAWWDDIWLNESFASFFAYLIIFNNKDFEIHGYKDDSVWEDLHDYKKRAYFLEKRCSKHPLMGHIFDTSQAKSSFDLITYNKGCGFLKQLLYLIGEKNLMSALKDYFSNNLWGNTSFPHLMKSLNKFTNRSNNFIDLEKFMMTWLTNRGVNIIQIVYDVDENNIIKRFEIHQTNLSETIYYQIYLIDIMAIFENNNELLENILILNDKITYLNDFVGKKAANAYLPNFNDWGYVLVRYDEKTLESMENTTFQFSKEYQRVNYLSNIRSVIINKK